jgi:citrate lyase subunit beta / citryl-CoA lyase
MHRSYLFAPGHNEKTADESFRADIAPPIDSVYPHINDCNGLHREATASRALGLFGKSAIHPAQLPIVHAAFDPDADEVTWARQVLAAFDQAGGAAAQLPSGEFIHLPVAQRARNILESAQTRPASRPD